VEARTSGETGVGDGGFGTRDHGILIGDFADDTTRTTSNQLQARRPWAECLWHSPMAFHATVSIASARLPSISEDGYSLPGLRSILTPTPSHIPLHYLRGTFILHWIKRPGSADLLLLSGAMLLASFTAVTQTFHLFARFMPTVLHATKTNFALLISQISGMYVISSALMLRA